MIPDIPPTSARARVSLGAFRHNLDAVRSYIGPKVHIMAVIKADGYGHGMAQMGIEAAKAGVTHFGVARVHEGVELRASQPSAVILVFEAPRTDTLHTAVQHRLDLTTVSGETTDALESAARNAGMKARVHVKVDTGMGRLGLPPLNALQVVQRVARSPWLELAGVYSHFATSEDTDKSFAHEQIFRFEGLLQALNKEGIEVPLRHMANSGAIISIPGAAYDMVRPGIMLYGYPPRDGMSERFPVTPVLSLVSRVAFVKEVPPDTGISYGRRYFTRRTTRIATIPMGYADGYPRLLTGKGSALINGVRYPVVGTICMDQLMLDLGPDAQVAVGEEVVLIGKSGSEQITAWDIGRAIGSIPYEITCVITGRVPRDYVP